MKTKEQIINKYLQQMTAELEQQGAARLNRLKVKASGSLLHSVNTYLQNATENNAGRMFMQFAAHGRLIDMRNLETAPNRPMEEIAAWVEQLGVEKFRRTFQAVRGRKLPVEKKEAAKAIAWGIVRGRHIKRKRKRWYAKKTWSSVYGIFEKMRIDLVDHYFEEQKQSLNVSSPG